MIDSQSSDTSKRRKCWHFTLWQPSIYWLVKDHDRKNKKFVFINNKRAKNSREFRKSKHAKTAKKQKKKEKEKRKKREYFMSLKPKQTNWIVQEFRPLPFQIKYDFDTVAAPRSGQGVPRNTLTWKKKIYIYNNLKIFIC